MDSSSPSYMLIFRETTPERYAGMTREERHRALMEWNGWCDRLAAEGKLLSGNTLAPEGRLVGGGGGKRVVDGPFAEAKELVGGYFLVSADSLDEAVAIAEQSPNLRYGMSVEVRPVGTACHLARSLGWSTMRGPAEEAPAATS